MKCSMADDEERLQTVMAFVIECITKRSASAQIHVLL